ncbi:hypothetical protein ACTXT7_013120, partial [Hymenolepis weldensis]
MPIFHKYHHPDEFLDVHKGSDKLLENADETFATWYTQYRDIYKNSLADLPHATRITMLLREFFNLTIHKDKMFSIMNVSLTHFALVSDLDLLKKINYDVSDFLSLLYKKTDVKKSHRRPESAAAPLTASTHFPSDNQPTNIAVRTATKAATKKASAENLMRKVQRGRTRKIREQTRRRYGELMQ